jgi:hypothetical protein
MSNTVFAAVTPTTYVSLGAGPMTIKSNTLSSPTLGTALSYLVYTGPTTPGSDAASEIISARDSYIYIGTDIVWIKAIGTNMDFLRVV